jgi:hypothetical protein
VDIELITSNFKSAFKPFYAKANVEVAPVNRFRSQDVVVLDEDMEWQGNGEFETMNQSSAAC